MCVVGPLEIESLGFAVMSQLDLAACGLNLIDTSVSFREIFYRNVLSLVIKPDCMHAFASTNVLYKGASLLLYSTYLLVIRTSP